MFALPTSSKYAQDSSGAYWKENVPSRGYNHLQLNCNHSTAAEVRDCIQEKTFSLKESVAGETDELFPDVQC